MSTGSYHESVRFDSSRATVAEVMSGSGISTTSRAASDRLWHLVIWGATGFTGRLVAETMARRYGGNPAVRWAIAGRDRGKLEKVRDDLGRVCERARDVPIVIADSGDRASLDALARDTRVVASAVGPFAVHGAELVGACVAAATDYCDITGETPFVREMIDRYHGQARATGARIVHCCGYDAIPSDLGTLMIQTHMRKTHATHCRVVKYFACETRGGLSGGTIASVIALSEAASSDPRVRRLLRDPYSLDPEHAGVGPDGPDARGVHWDDDVGGWTAPFTMAAVNTRVVRRTNALLGYAYGHDFRYSEMTSLGPGAGGWLAAMAVSAATAGIRATMRFPAVARLAARALLPAPGQGPSRRTREAGRFTSRLVGLASVDRAHATKVFAVVRGVSDPGYGETAKMLVESAVCLAMDREAIAHEGGVLTPAACMGMRLVERLRDAGMTFETSTTPI
ncbi:MAG: saccharopine dehydrogenase [Polyangiaceae bacterium]